MAAQDRLEQRVVGGVGQHGVVDERVVRQGAGGAHPDPLVSDPVGGRGREEVALDVPLVDGPALGHVPGRRVVDALEELGQARERVGGGGLRERVLVVEAGVGVLERGAHRQDRLAVLDGVHPAGREGAAVTHALDAERDRLGVVAGAHEVRVQ